MIKEMIASHKFHNNDKSVEYREFELWERFKAQSNKPKAIPRFYGEFNNGKLQLIFDYYPNTLQDLILQRIKLASTPFPFIKINEIFVVLINAFAFLQNNGICHRDLKPSNLYLDSNFEQIYIFDICENKELITSASEVDKNEFIFNGSSKYFSPELYQKTFMKVKVEPGKEKTLNHFKSDVFSLGLIMLELGNLDLPIKVEEDNETLQENIKNQIEILRNSYTNRLCDMKEKKLFCEFVEILKNCLEITSDLRPDFKSIFIELIKNDIKKENFTKFENNDSSMMIEKTSKQADKSNYFENIPTDFSMILEKNAKKIELNSQFDENYDEISMAIEEKEDNELSIKSIEVEFIINEIEPPQNTEKTLSIENAVITERNKDWFIKKHISGLIYIWEIYLIIY